MEDWIAALRTVQNREHFEVKGGIHPPRCPLLSILPSTYLHAWTIQSCNSLSQRVPYKIRLLAPPFGWPTRRWPSPPRWSISEEHLIVAICIFPFQPTQYSMDHFSGMHNWYACSHARPTYCNVCREALSGVTSHGLSCEGTSDVLPAGRGSLRLDPAKPYKSKHCRPRSLRTKVISVTPCFFILPTEESLINLFL